MRRSSTGLSPVDGSKMVRDEALVYLTVIQQDAAQNEGRQQQQEQQPCRKCSIFFIIVHSQLLDTSGEAAAFFAFFGLLTGFCFYTAADGQPRRARTS